jgi:hypothetical protein
MNTKKTDKTPQSEGTKPSNNDGIILTGSSLDPKEQANKDLMDSVMADAKAKEAKRPPRIFHA